MVDQGVVHQAKKRPKRGILQLTHLTMAEGQPAQLLVQSTCGRTIVMDIPRSEWTKENRISVNSIVKLVVDVEGALAAPLNCRPPEPTVRRSFAESIIVAFDRHPTVSNPAH